jgi:hypothetical protein
LGERRPQRQLKVDVHAWNLASARAWARNRGCGHGILVLNRRLLNLILISTQQAGEVLDRQIDSWKRRHFPRSRTTLRGAGVEMQKMRKNECGESTAALL